MTYSKYCEKLGIELLPKLHLGRNISFKDVLYIFFE